MGTLTSTLDREPFQIFAKGFILARI